MDVVVLVGVSICCLVGEISSYPFPLPLPSGYGSGPLPLPSGYGSGPLPLPSGYGSGPGHDISVDTNANQIWSPLSNVGEIVNAKINQAVDSKAVQFVTPFPDSGRKTAVLESPARESIPIQADIKYANLQQFIANLLNPRPIVDTIQEHEKYGNDGGKGRSVGTLVVAGFEGLSNALNAAVDTPFQAAKTVGRKITHSLNQIGGKLVGLA